MKTKMTFLSELKSLREAATKDHMYQNKLSTYLYNHAEAIEELVKAAENEVDYLESVGRGSPALKNALANLNKEK